MKTKAIQQKEIILRYDWTTQAVAQLFQLPFLELMYQAITVHREVFPAGSMQVSTLLNIKTGSCPEDCQYCPQSAHYNTGLKKEPLMSIETVRTHAKAAKAYGATRFCMGAAWKKPPEKEFETVLQMIKIVQEEGLETCVTLGSLSQEQARALKEQGLNYYNHNLDTSPRYYEKIITTRTYQERLETLQHIRKSGIKTCCGGIVGMGETFEDRIELLCQLARFNPHPESVPINKLVPIPGTPLAESKGIDPFDFVRIVAVARILMPKTKIRLSAGRESMSQELQTLCFLAGANSIFYGEKLLTTKNPSIAQDKALFKKLGLSFHVTE